MTLLFSFSFTIFFQDVNLLTLFQSGPKTYFIHILLKNVMEVCRKLHRDHMNKIKVVKSTSSHLFLQCLQAWRENNQIK